MDANPTVTCSVTLEWLNSQGSVLRKITYRSCTLRIIRNEHRAMFVEATAGKSKPLKLSVIDIQIHNKFMNEGKATLKFKKENCTMLLSNAPPASLIKFLQTIVIKYAVDPKNKEISLRKQLLSNKPVQYDEISPVTNAELEKVRTKAVSRTTETTPSPSARKRKVEEKGAVRGPVAKKLYAPSPSFEEEMNIEQREVLETCLAGKNVFFTGSAGTGKSFLLRKIIAALPPDCTIATASTGVAACHIGGITLHQFAGIGRGEATLENCYKMASKPLRAQIWRRCKHLIIDEISMIDGKYFEKIEAVARKIRNSEKPFGGIQLILCGDFFQLPPVFNKNQQSSKEQTGKFCFQSKAWDQCVQRVFELRQVHRQKDKKFVDLLNKIRVGEITNEILDILTATSKQKIETDGILATRLCSHTQDANIINESKLNALPGEPMTFIAEDSSTVHTKELDAQTPVPGKLILKIGAQVMLLKNINISKGLVNGARGVVKRFENGVPVVKFRNDEYTAKQERWTMKTAEGSTLSRKQIPLRLAWAFSIHKSQGLTLDCVEMSLSRVFEAGQAYVALSRAQSLETLRVLDFRASQVWANPDVLKFYTKIKRQIEEMEIIPLAPARVREANKEKIKKVKSLAKLMSKPIVTIS